MLYLTNCIILVEKNTILLLCVGDVLLSSNCMDLCMGQLSDNIDDLVVKYWTQRLLLGLTLHKCCRWSWRSIELKSLTISPMSYPFHNLCKLCIYTYIKLDRIQLTTSVFHGIFMIVGYCVCILVHMKHQSRRKSRWFTSPQKTATTFCIDQYRKSGGPHGSISCLKMAAWKVKWDKIMEANTGSKLDNLYGKSSKITLSLTIYSWGNNLVIQVVSYYQYIFNFQLGMGHPIWISGNDKEDRV